jgi:hypothetical protein
MNPARAASASSAPQIPRANIAATLDKEITARTSAPPIES